MSAQPVPGFSPTLSPATVTADPPGDASAPLLVDAKNAARLLDISPRKLWSLTASGEIAPVRIGRSIRYSMDSLHEFIARHVAPR